MAQPLATDEWHSQRKQDLDSTGKPPSAAGNTLLPELPLSGLSSVRPGPLLQLVFENVLETYLDQRTDALLCNLVGRCLRDNYLLKRSQGSHMDDAALHTLVEFISEASECSLEQAQAYLFNSLLGETYLDSRGSPLEMTWRSLHTTIQEIGEADFCYDSSLAHGPDLEFLIERFFRNGFDLLSLGDWSAFENHWEQVGARLTSLLSSSVQEIRLSGALALRLLCLDETTKNLATQYLHKLFSRAKAGNFISEPNCLFPILLSTQGKGELGLVVESAFSAMWRDLSPNERKNFLRLHIVEQDLKQHPHEDEGVYPTLTTIQSGALCDETTSLWCISECIRKGRSELSAAAALQAYLPLVREFIRRSGGSLADDRHLRTLVLNSAHRIRDTSMQMMGFFEGALNCVFREVAKISFEPGGALKLYNFRHFVFKAFWAYPDNFSQKEASVLRTFGSGFSAFSHDGLADISQLCRKEVERGVESSSRTALVLRCIAFLGAAAKNGNISALKTLCSWATPKPSFLLHKLQIPHYETESPSLANSSPMWFRRLATLEAARCLRIPN